MKAPILPLLLLLSGCDPSGKGGTAPSGESARAQSHIAGLIGLYEGDAARVHDRLCVVGRGADAHFGIVVVGRAGGSCSGAGAVTRFGNSVRLTMQGDSACALSARIEGGTLVFPSQVPIGCAYYCAPGASLARARFVQNGTTAKDALRARDLVGDPLCRPRRS